MLKTTLLSLCITMARVTGGVRSLLYGTNTNGLLKMTNFDQLIVGDVPLVSRDKGGYVKIILGQCVRTY